MARSRAILLGLLALLVFPGAVPPDDHRAHPDLAARIATVKTLGLVEGTRFYRLFYIAPERHYFARDLPVFEELARTFRLRKPAAPR